MWHKLMHILGWWSGGLVSKFDEDNKLWMGLKCSKCGKICGRHITNY